MGQPRDASGPAKGALQNVGRTAPAGILLAYGASQLMPDVPADVQVAAALAAMTVLTSVIAPLGKWLRSKGIDVPF